MRNVEIISVFFPIVGYHQVSGKQLGVVQGPQVRQMRVYQTHALL